MTHGSAAGTKPLTSSVFYILMALADEDRYGLGIVEEVARRTDGEVVLGPGTLYNAIQKMLGQGLIEETAAEGPNTDPRRRYYRITEAGLQTVGVEAERLDRVLDAARDKQLLPERRA